MNITLLGYPHVMLSIAALIGCLDVKYLDDIDKSANWSDLVPDLKADRGSGSQVLHGLSPGGCDVLIHCEAKPRHERCNRDQRRRDRP
jgi:hypothetical protein